MSRYTKAIIAVATAGLVALAEALPEYNDEVQIALAVLGAVGVYLFPNKQTS